jgi:hypothetical protein
MAMQAQSLITQATRTTASRRTRTNIRRGRYGVGIGAATGMGGKTLTRLL